MSARGRLGKPGAPTFYFGTPLMSPKLIDVESWNLVRCSPFAGTMVCRHTWRFINVLIIIKTAKINVKNFHGSLTTVVRAQNDTSKTANITYTIFDRTYWYSPYKRRRSENRWDQTFCILLIKDVMWSFSVILPFVLSFSKEDNWFPLS